MARLILMFNKQIIKEYPFGKEGVTIGRNEDNTITIDNLAVSGYHARFDMAGPDFILTDLQSTNGTFVNDKKIVSHKLSHGDNVRIGKHVILFVGVEEGKAGEEAKKMLDLDRTMMLDTAKQKELLAKQQAAHQVAKAPEKIGVIEAIDRSDMGEIELTKKLIKIGKADSSEIKLSGFFMPSTVATISRRPSGYMIAPASGKVKINGEVLKDSVQLKDFDTIEVGSYKLQFYEKEIKKE